MKCLVCYLELFYISTVKTEKTIPFLAKLDLQDNEMLCCKKKKCCKKYKKGEPCKKCPKF